MEAPAKFVLDPRTAAALEAARKECGEGKWGPDDGATATAWVAYQMSDNAPLGRKRKKHWARAATWRFKCLLTQRERDMCPENVGQ